MFKKTHKAGFTLFEMLVSVGIIVLISGVVFFNHSKFKSDTEITNLAYRMALAIREAQVYSISVKQFDLPDAQNFNTPYGIHLNQEVNNSYLMFADVGDGDGGESDGLYSSGDFSDSDCDVSDSSECVEKTTISRNNVIKGWCGIFWSGDPEDQPCFKGGEGSEHFLDIKFKRPNPDAIFKVYEGSYKIDTEMGAICEGGSGAVACTGWTICLVAPDGKQRQVVVYETGQISVQNVASDGVGCDSI